MKEMLRTCCFVDAFSIFQTNQSLRGLYSKQYISDRPRNSPGTRESQLSTTDTRESIEDVSESQQQVLSGEKYI